MFEQLGDAIQFTLGQHQLTLLNPSGLWLLLLVPLMWIVGQWMGRDLRWYRRLGIALVRSAAVAALSIAFAHPVQIERENAPAVVLAADLSDSLDPAARQGMEERLRELWQARGTAPAYLVGFGRYPRLLAGPQEKRISLQGSDVPGDGSDISAALRFSYGLFPPGYDRRVVIFSDGEQTRGDLVAEALRARDLGIEVSVAPLRPAATFDARVEEIRAPAQVRLQDPWMAEAVVMSSAPRRVEVRWSRDGVEVERRALALGAGENRVPLKLAFDTEGWHTVELRLLSRQDRFAQNNHGAARVFVSSFPRVLLVRTGSETTPLHRVFQGMRLRLDTHTPEALEQRNLLSESDLIVLDDLPLAKLSKTAVENLRAVVEELGAGLIVTAGPASSELAGPEDSPIESLLPVSFRQVKKREEIPAALAFVMDRSSSMARGEKFVILLRAVADTLDRVRDSAQVSLVMFDDYPEVVVPLTEARNREAIRKILMAQRVGGGTSMFPGLEAAHRELKRSAAKLRHVVLLSDGQSITMYDQFGYIVEAMAKDRITVSVVALGQDADLEELRRISGATGGRLYHTDSIRNVPQIFTAETEKFTQSNVVEQPLRAEPVKMVQALAGIDFSTAPPLGGALASEARPTAEVLLRTSDRREPLLSRWRFGLGRVALFSSDAQGAWSGAWTNWDGFGRLWSQLAEDTLRRSPPGDLRLRAVRDGERAVVTVRTVEDLETPGAEPKVVCLGSTLAARPVPLERRGPGLFRGEIPLPPGGGVWAFQAERPARRGGRETAYAFLNRTFGEEYLSGAGQPELLEQAARAGGGQVDPEPRVVFAPGQQDRRTQHDRWSEFVWMALGLFLLEVLVRRL